ncbi:phage tail protein [Desmospora profundinema]|uniref:Phage-related protein n=1 Tax=Desmospora profundinema TaxID=1571184 RepID=A0ABU1IKZ0_9BACL|nr:hypothetical protein [Desmospora profundinema]MDR6225452.1 phage-related protein [Desmospora profundinema]
MTASNEVEFNKKIKGLSEAMDKVNSQLKAAATSVGGTITVVLGLSVAASPEVNEAFGQLQESLNLAKENIGEALAPAILTVINVVKDFVDAFNQLPAPIQTFLVFAGTFMIVLLGLLPVIASLASAFVALAVAEWSALAPVLAIVAAIVAILAIFALLGYALIQAYNRFSWFREVVDTVWLAIKEAFNTALTFIQGIVQSVMTAVTEFFQSQLQRIQAFWQENGELIMAAVRRVWGWIQPFISVVMAAIAGTIRMAWMLIQAVTMFVWNGIKGFISTALTAIMGIVKAVAQLITGDWRGALNTLRTATGNVLKGIVNTFNNMLGGLPAKAVTWGKNLIKGFIDGIKGMLGKLSGVVGDVVGVVGDFLGFSSPTKRGPGRTSHRWAPNFMEMFTAGIQAGVPDVRTAATDVASTLAIVGQNEAGSTPPSIRQPMEIHISLDGEKIMPTVRRELTLDLQASMGRVR